MVKAKECVSITRSLAMPRRYYKRRSYKPRKKWNSNFYNSVMKVILPSLNTQTGYAQLYNQHTLIENPIQPISGSSTNIVKVKNIKVQLAATGAADASPELLYSMQLAIVFMPEGYVADATVLQKHPEWLMAYKLVTLDSASSMPINVSISSRLARNLNSGDKIALVVIPRTTKYQNTTEFIDAIGLETYITVQFWTCAN